MLLFVTPVWSLAQEPEESEEKEPSLADIARKERERRARIDKPVKVITNATLKDIKGVVSSSTASSSSRSASPDEGDPDPSEDRKKDALEWENLFGGARERLVSSIDQGEQLELRMTELSSGWMRVSAGDTDSTLEEEFNRQTQQIGQELEDNKQEIQAARDAIEALEREARLEGVLPGTIRQMVEDLP
jgi:hypothetical protein